MKPVLFWGPLFLAAASVGGEDAHDKTPPSSSTEHTEAPSATVGGRDDALNRACIDHLLMNMPSPDRHNDNVTDMLLTSTVDLALRARADHAWAAAVPLDIFLDNVLPYAFINEPRELWRQMFYKTITPLVKEASSISEAARIIHQHIWTLYSVKYVADQTPYSMSPLTVIAHGNASCTGMSIFFASACRTVGIPARVVGTPHWNRGQEQCPDGDESPNCGNHDWVEVWDGSWSFVDVTDTTATLEYNKTWFFPDPARLATPGDNNHSIYAAEWTRSEGLAHFPMGWDWDDHSVPGIDITERYLQLSASATDAPAGTTTTMITTTTDATTDTTTTTTNTDDSTPDTKTTTGTVSSEPLFQTKEQPPWWVQAMGGWDEGAGAVA